MPITAHSSWCDCCVAVISLVGGRRATAESLYKNSLPVPPAWENVCVCVHLCRRFKDALLRSFSAYFLMQLLTCPPGPYRAVSLHIAVTFSTFNFTNSSRKNEEKKNYSRRIDYHFTAGPQAMCLQLLIEFVTGTVEVLVKMSLHRRGDAIEKTILCYLEIKLFYIMCGIAFPLCPEVQ